MEKSLVFGGKCIVLSMSYSQKQLLWRTLQLSLFEGLEGYLDRYPRSGTMRNGVLYELQILEPLILERDGSALLIKKRLDSILQTKGRLLPTPIKRMSKNNPSTPGAWKQHTEPNVEYCKAFGITKEEAIGANFRTNPRFIEEMMGFPIGWTELQP